MEGPEQLLWICHQHSFIKSLSQCASLWWENFIPPKKAVGEVLTHLKETVKPQWAASHCIREGKRIVKRTLHFTSDCQKWEWIETEQGFARFLNLLVNNSLAMTMTIKPQTSFFCPFIFQPAKTDFRSIARDLLSNFHFSFPLSCIAALFLLSITFDSSQLPFLATYYYCSSVFQCDIPSAFLILSLCCKKPGPFSIMLLIGFWPSRTPLLCLCVILIFSTQFSASFYASFYISFSSLVLLLNILPSWNSFSSLKQVLFYQPLFCRKGGFPKSVYVNGTHFISPLQR